MSPSITPSGGGGGGSLPASWTDDGSGNVTAESTDFGIPITVQGTLAGAQTLLALLGHGETNPDLDAQVKVIGHSNYALLLLMDPGQEGNKNVAVLEFGSAGEGTNNPSHLSNTGAAYLSTVLANDVVVDLDTAETGGWIEGPSTAPVIRFGSMFQVGPKGEVTIAPSGGAAPLTLTGLPTVDPAVAGQVWSNSGVLTVSAG